MGPKAGLEISAKEKNTLLQPGIKPGFLSSPVHSLVTILSYAGRHHQRNTCYCLLLHSMMAQMSNSWMDITMANE